MIFCALLITQNLSAQLEMSKQDKKKNKQVYGLWKVKHIKKSGRVIDIQSIIGESTMKFYPYKKKDNKTGKKYIVNKFKMDMGGRDRIFDYTVIGDSIKFLKVNGWNDFKIIELSKEAFEVDHLSAEGDIIRWVMIRKKEEKEKKKKK